MPTSMVDTYSKKSRALGPLVARPSHNSDATLRNDLTNERLSRNHAFLQRGEGRSCHSSAIANLQAANQYERRKQHAQSYHSFR